MAESLRVLMLEDNPADAELIQFELQEAGFVFTAKVVTTEEDFVRELQEYSADLILSDYDLPKYNGALALAEARRRCPNTPFILVTGAVTEDRAIEILTQGAKDYVLKSRLEQRLGPAVKRTLAEAEEHKKRKKVEEELHEAHRTLEEQVKARTAELEVLNRQMQALFDYSSASLVLFDAKRPYTVLAHNKYYQELWDEPFRTKGMVGKNLLDYVPVAEQSGVMAVYDEVVQTKQARNLIGFPYEGMPHGKTWWNWHLSPVMKEGEVIALAHMGIDVTKEVQAREEAERRAKEAEEGKDILNALMACIPEGITIARAPDVVTTMISKYGGDLLLRGWDTAKDLSMEDWLAKVEHFLADGHTPARTEDLPLWRAVKCGEIVEGKELRLRRPTGEWLPVLCNAAPIRDMDGNITGGIVAWRDITERKRTEDELALSEREFRLLAESMPQIVWTTRVDGWNKPFHPDDQQRAWDAWQNAVLHNAPYLLQCRLRRADGIYRWWLIQGVPVLDENGNIIKWHGTCTDINDMKQAEEAMLLSQNQFNLLTRNIRSGVALIDSNGKFAVVNPSFLRMFGLKDDETINNVNDKNWNDWQVFESDGTLLHVDEHPVRKAAITGKPVKDKLVGVRLPSGGDLIWMLISADLMRRPDGNIQSIICTYHDITERKQAEETLKESEKKYRELVKYAPIGIYEIDFRSRKLVTINDAMMLLTGYTREELLSMDVLDLLYDESKKAFTARISKMLQGEKPDENIEYKVIAKDGHIIEAVMNVSFKFDEQGKPIGATVVGHDITERKRAEEALRKSEGRWNAVLENLSIGTIIATEAEQVIYWNPVARSIHDFKSENEGIEQLEETPNTFELWTVDGVHKLILDDWPMRRIKRGESVLNLELRLRRPDQGWEKFVLYSGEMVETPGGEKLIFLSVYDITEQKQAEKALVERTRQLEEANKELESFSYSVSHDLRAPLRAIDGFSRKLEREFGDKTEEKFTKTIDVIRTNVKIMGHLIEDLLSFSRVQKTEMNIAVIDMHQLVGEVWNDIIDANQQLDLEFKANNILSGYGDRALIRQVLFNLLSNAVKFAKDRKPAIIEVTSYPESDNIVYSVKDNGVGFDMKYYDKLFGVFRRLHGEEYEGTGIGLAIVSHIVQRHGGRVWAEGQADKGATFYFTLPSKTVK